jgi:hypothetical protein
MDTVNLDHAEALATLGRTQVTAGLGVHPLVVLAPMGFGIGLCGLCRTCSIFGHPSLGGASVGSHGPQVAEFLDGLIEAAHPAGQPFGCLAHIVGVFARRKAPSLVEGKPAAAANTLVPSTIGLNPTESRHERRPLKSLGFGWPSTGANLSRTMSPRGLLDDQLHRYSAHGRQCRRQRSPQRHHGHALAAQRLLFNLGQFLDERFQSLQSQSCDIGSSHGGASFLDS